MSIGASDQWKEEEEEEKEEKEDKEEEEEEEEEMVEGKEELRGEKVRTD